MTDIEPDQTVKTAFFHAPVLSQELIEGLAVRPGGHYLDATVGGGGHSSLILATPDVQVTAIDRDEQAIGAARAQLAAYGDRIHFASGNFAQYDPSGVLFDGIIC